jgi:hypothetical protein
MRCEVGAWQTRRVVITRFGAVTPLGNDRETTWRNLIAGNSGVGPITAFDASDLAVRIAAEVHGFDPAAVLDRRRLRRTARFAQFAVAAAREVVGDARLAIGDGADTGIVINAAVAGFDTIEAAARQLVEGSPRPGVRSRLRDRDDGRAAGAGPPACGTSPCSRPGSSTATAPPRHYKLRDEARAGAGLDDFEKPVG